MRTVKFILVSMLVLVLAACAGLVASAPKLIADGITVYQAAVQIKGIAQTLAATAKTQASEQTCAAPDPTLSEKMDAYAKWADTIAKAAAEIQAGINKKE